MPDLASRKEASTSWVLLPMDETMPIPVTTTRLIAYLFKGSLMPALTTQQVRLTLLILNSGPCEWDESVIPNAQGSLPRCGRPVL
jgi:hypothetical protein